MNNIDYQKVAQRSIIPYFQTNDDIAVILDAASLRFKNLHDVISYLADSYNIDEARGEWLNKAGAEVGAQRDEKDFGNYFCVNRKHINESKRFYFVSSGKNPESPLSLSDAEFIQKIYAYIGANSSCGTRNEVIEIIKMITNADKVIISQIDKCVIKIKLAGKSLVLTQNTILYIQQIVGDSVYIDEITY